jgi:NADH-quinone oxidoreductase subunit L
MALLAIPFAPLVAAILAGLFGRFIGRAGAHSVTILGVAVAFGLSLSALVDQLHGAATVNETLYTFAVTDGLTLKVGFLIDHLTVLMMCVVTSVSLMVHIYTIGYMHDDPGYQRFFSYISLFTFAMLMLVMSNNFLQLFFGWEAVGLVSYLLIGFWYTRPTAVFANMKAFLVNRVGDLGFLVGIAALVSLTHSLDYRDAFASVPQLSSASLLIGDSAFPALTVICIGLFIGAMGKSAQVPLHVWLPDSMEGPTPISALIHAATMVTAGIFMVARMSPLFEHSETALSFVLVIGSTTALFMGFLGIIANDIKRVVAYSTLSQLGYMTAALGVSAYPVAIFHLMTHAFFKALLFLGAGSVIIAMHHEQDMRHMGGLRRYLPITYATSLLGALALIGFPGFSGFYSKDILIEAIQASHTAGHEYAAFCVTAGVFITAFYTFRMIFMTFHGPERFDEHTREHLHESPWVVTLPLVLLAIPSVVIGALSVQTVLFGDFFNGVISVLPQHDVLGEIREEFHSPLDFALGALTSPTLLLAMGGVVLAWVLYLKKPHWPALVQAKIQPLYRVLEQKYFFDWFNEHIVSGGARVIGTFFWKVGDQAIIDSTVVNGSAWVVGQASKVLRKAQSGYLYHYAFAMMIALALMLAWFIGSF